MINSPYSKLLIPGSFLLPKVNDAEIANVTNLIIQTGHKPILAITKEIAQLSFYVQASYQQKQRVLEQRMGIDEESIKNILVGFRTPLVVIYNCYTQSVPLFDFSIAPRPSSDHILRTIQKFQQQIVKCRNEHVASTITSLYTHCEKLAPQHQNESYILGNVASLTTYREFLTLLRLKRLR